MNFLKFPACGCDDDFFGCGFHSCNDKSCDRGKSCDKCPDCPTCPPCPTCAVPALQINKIEVLSNQTDGHPINITYTYNITNTGNVPVSEINLYDNQTIPNRMLVPGITILNPGQSATTTPIYTGPFHTTHSPSPILGTLYGNITECSVCNSNW